MTDLPLWVTLGACAGLAGSVLWIVSWFFGVRRSLAKKGWKYTSTVWVLLPTLVLAGSATELLLGWPLANEITAALLWIVLATMVAGIMLDAVRRTRQPS